MKKALQPKVQKAKTVDRILSRFKKPETRYVWLNVLPDDLWLEVNQGQTVWEALQEVLSATPEDYGRIPVVGRDDRDRLVGVLRRHEIAGAYRGKLAQIGKAAKYG